MATSLVVSLDSLRARHILDYAVEVMLFGPKVLIPVFKK